MIDHAAYLAEVNETNPFLRHNHMQAVYVDEERAVVQAQMSPELRKAFTPKKFRARPFSSRISIHRIAAPVVMIH